MVRANVDRVEAKNEGKRPEVKERKRMMEAGANHASDERVEARNAG